VLQTNEQLFGRQHRLTLADADNLAITFSLLDRFPEAETLLRKTADDRARFMSDGDPDRATSTYNLGAVFIAERRFAEAEAILFDVLASRAELLGPDSDRGMEVQDNLAMVRLFQPERAAMALEPARILVDRTRSRRGDSGADLVTERRIGQLKTTHNDWFHYLAEGAGTGATRLGPDAAQRGISDAARHGGGRGQQGDCAYGGPARSRQCR